MLTVTPAALTRFSELLAESEEASALRIAVVEQDLALVPDQVRTGDSTFEHDGKVVLVLDETIADLLEDRTLDVEPTDEGTRLTLR